MAKNTEVSQVSVEYVEFPVEAKHNDVVADPTIYAATIALKATGVEPADADFKAAVWGITNGKNVVRFLVGSANFPVAVGFYDVWCKIATGTETPKHKIGVLEVY